MTKPYPFRIVVCTSCGKLYDIHYIDKVRIQRTITMFECTSCGMVPVTYKTKCLGNEQNCTQYLCRKEDEQNKN